MSHIEGQLGLTLADTAKEHSEPGTLQLTISSKHKALVLICLDDVKWEKGKNQHQRHHVTHYVLSPGTRM